MPSSFLLAFDKFKDALTASETCQTAREALLSAQPGATVTTAPLADGGDGFCDTLTRVAEGTFKTCPATGPHGESLEAQFSIVDVSKIPDAAISLLSLPSGVAKIAIIEMATSSGIAKVAQEKRSPWIATTAGVGDQIKTAIEAGAEAVLLGVGGSATHDLGLGALQSLGYRFEFASSETEPATFPIPNTWKNLQRILTPDALPTKDIPIRVACDVDNPLLGERGSAAVFGPQKGLKPEDYTALEELTASTADLLLQASNQSPALLSAPGTGAAGGIAFGFMAALSAQLVPGYELVKAWIGLEAKFAQADIIVTGEGRFDESSLGGKGPGSLLKESLAANKTVYVFAGSLGDFQAPPIPAKQLIAISPKNLSLPEALAATEENLRRCITETFS